MLDFTTSVMPNIFNKIIQKEDAIDYVKYKCNFKTVVQHMII